MDVNSAIAYEEYRNELDILRAELERVRDYMKRIAEAAGENKACQTEEESVSAICDKLKELERVKAELKRVNEDLDYMYEKEAGESL